MSWVPDKFDGVCGTLGVTLNNYKDFGDEGLWTFYRAE